MQTSLPQAPRPEPIAIKTVVIDGQPHQVKVYPYIAPLDSEVVWAHRRRFSQDMDPIPYGGLGQYIQTAADKE